MPVPRTSTISLISELCRNGFERIEMEEPKNIDAEFSANKLRREEALREYYHVESKIDKYDEIRLKIKSWSVTSSGVAIGFAFAEKQPALFALASLGSFIFWYLDASRHVGQQKLIDLNLEIELALSESSTEYHGPSIARTFNRTFRTRVTKRRLFRTMFFGDVWTPHFVIVVLGIALSVGARLYG